MPIRVMSESPSRHSTRAAELPPKLRLTLPAPIYVCVGAAPVPPPTSDHHAGAIIQGGDEGVAFKISYL